MPTDCPPSTCQSTADDDREVFVRPIGFVEDHAVVRRVGDRELFIGNRHAADPARHDYGFDFVLSLTADRQPATTHHQPLVDGPGNDWATFAAAVDAACELGGRDGSVLVHCTAGISRSPTILATAIAAEEGASFADALARVRDARPHAVANPALRELAVVYLAADS